MQRYRLRKRLLLVTWPLFFGVAFAALVVTTLTFAGCYYAFDTLMVVGRPHATFSDAIEYSAIQLIGGTSPPGITNNAQRVAMLQSLTRFVIFPIFVGLLLARMGKARNAARFARRVAFHLLPSGVMRLEFRLIVYPSAPIFIQEITATVSHASDSGGRENQPLPFEPIRAVKVAYYLGFRAYLPEALVKSANWQRGA